MKLNMAELDYCAFALLIIINGCTTGEDDVCDSCTRTACHQLTAE